MRLRYSIFSKLLLVILPLVCLPIAIVGYLAFKASVEHVNRLVRQEQMLHLEAAARTIDHIFYNCRLDLETVASLPMLEDYRLARLFRLDAEARFNYENIVRVFHDFILRTPQYRRFLFLDAAGRMQVQVDAAGPVKEPAGEDLTSITATVMNLKESEVYFSEVSVAADRGPTVYAAKPFITGLGERAGLVLIELDFDRIGRIVKAIRVGENGYAFLVDENGRNVVHPRYRPYDLNRFSGSDESLGLLLDAMTEGQAGWKSYRFEGQEKEAAYAPVPSMGWSLAVTIPTAEFRREARAIQTRVIQVVMAALLLVVVGVSVLSYNLLRPVSRLVEATNRIARGEPPREIPVEGRDELAELTRSFNHMVRNLTRVHSQLLRSEKLISLGRLSAGMAHEIRNPLNAMKGAIVYIQRRRAEDPVVTEYTQVVLEEIDRLSRFVTEILYFSRQSPPKRTTTDLKGLIESVQNLFEAWEEEDDVRFYNHFDPGLPPVELDPRQFERVLVNLIVNAKEAMPGGGPIIFTTSLVKPPGGPEEASGRVRIMVEDEGVGIRKEDMGAIFDPFFTTKESGTGLGLPLSLGIVENHGGTLTVSIRPGGGTNVTIELPIPAGSVEEGQA
ncbi:MAG: HAMP domain-containing protein [Proteobacteria bacterium]|nr:HAMP domain-containing protein [Pseudomonadota bacterium]